MMRILGLVGLLAVGFPLSLQADDAWMVEGVVVPTRSLTIRSRAPGTITETMVDVGSVVKKGENLLRFDDQKAKLELQMVELGMKKKEIEYRQFEAHRERAKAQSDRHKAEYDRHRALFSSKTISENEFNKSEAQYSASTAEAQHISLQAELAKLELEIVREQAKVVAANLDALSVRAPFDGIVVSVYGKPGDFAANANQPLVDLIAGPNLIEAAVPDRVASKLKIGQAVEISVDGDTFEKGTVTIISPVADTQTRSVKIRITPDAELKGARPGQVVGVREKKKS
ncbi:MAG: efflux RND transporter periplasmic adaptor subunit [Planctomycetes bacterium]|nr:efflux RND transporter periplasmic adaptor subunit [Planctomycetota bacterium]